MDSILEIIFLRIIYGIMTYQRLLKNSEYEAKIFTILSDRK